MDFFEPQLTLLAEPDGEFTLHSSTLVPSQGFSVAGVRPNQVPANIRIVPEAFPILLMLRQIRVDTFARPALRTHRISDLKLTGRTTIVGFVCLEGNPIDQVLGMASIPTLALTPTSKASGIVSSSDWACWVEMGPSGSVLHVTGVVFTSTPGYSVSLQLTSPQGINPRELLLDLTVKHQPGPAPEVIVPHAVRFETANHDYQGVTILEPGGNGTRIPVGNAAVL
jgi:hypothetical protein